MAQWSDYINLFPSDEQTVIQELQVILTNDFGFANYEAYESGFSSITPTYFQGLSASSNPFILALSTWLGNKASQVGDWGNYVSLFNSNDQGYVNLIIQSNQGTPIQDFVNQENSTRAESISNISGFWNEYINMLSAYIQEVPPEVTITSQPSNQNVCEGSSASFTVVASGSGLSYQWKKNGSNISGATSATYSISSASTSDEGNYSCVVTSGGTNVTSNSASLTVKDEVEITAQPQSIEIDAGSNHTFQVTANGSAPISYQWRKDGSNISGATSNSLVLNNATTDDSGSYDCLVSNSCGSESSNVAELVVEEYIEITAQPLHQRVPLGETATIEISATATGTITYQWRKNGVPIPSSNSSTYVINELTQNDLGSYDCILSIASGLSKISTLIKLTMEEEVIINGHPESTEINWSDDHTLSVIVAGAEPISFQWRKNGVPISDATNSSYTLTSVTSIDSGQYDCIVSNSYGQKISSKATIEVSSFSSEIATVFGKVTNSKGVPLENITVKVVDRIPGNSKVLATVTTDMEGDYKAEYLKSELLNQEVFMANLNIQLFADGDAEPSETSELIENASNKEEVNFSTNVFASEQTEYEDIEAYINSKIDAGDDINEFTDEDKELLATKAFPIEKISAYINANKLSLEISGVTREQFYGLMRNKLPSKADQLAVLDESKLKNGFLEASASNIIDSIDEDTAEDLAEVINTAAAELVEQSESNPFKSALDKTSLTTTQKQNVVKAQLNDPTGATNIFESSIDGLSTSEVDEVKRIITLQEIDTSNQDIVSVLDDQVGTSGTPTNLEDIIGFETINWEGLIDDNNEDKLSIPPRFTGSEAEKKTAYAQELMGEVEKMEPTKFLVNRIQADSSHSDSDFDQFFTDHPNFELGGTQIAKFIDENPLGGAYTDPVVLQETLEARQRLYHLVPSVNRFNTMKPLLDANLTSASKITVMGENDFVANYSAELGEKVAKEVYNNSAQVYGKVLHTLVANTNTPSPLVIGNQNLNDTDDEVVGIPSLESLFGSIDYCECVHCRSVYSPAAYLVDLLNFIDHNVEVLNDDEPPTSITKNIKDELLIRRGEIQKLLLNCDNTNVPIPYIDIVNEILENYIANNTSYVNQTMHDADTLRATAQYVVEGVYNTDLLSTKYPYQMPFNLWFEQIKIYLNKTGVELGELIEVSPNNGLSDIRKNVIAAAASLGISLQQLDIIIDVDNDLTETELYDGLGQGDFDSIEQFIETVGISYELFISLLDSKYINNQKKEIYFPEDGSCNLSAMTWGTDANPSLGFSPTELKRFNRFLRLHSLSGWDIKDLDLVINTIGREISASKPLNEDTIISINHIAKLKDRFQLNVEEMIIWWSDFDISTYVDQALFDKLFQDTSVNYKEGIVPALFAIDSGTPLPTQNLNDTELKPLVLGALNLDSAELDLLLTQGELTNSSASIENFSQLYRVASFVKATGLSFKEYFNKRDLSGLNPISTSTNVATPQDTITFLESLSLIESSNFTESEIEYLLSGDSSSELALNEEKIIDFLEELRDDYQSLGIDFSEVSGDLESEIEILINEFIANRTTLDQVISGDVDAINQTTYFESNFQNINEIRNIIVDANEMVSFQTMLDNVTGSNEEKVTKRKKIVYGFLQRFKFVNTDFKSGYTEKLALFYDLSVDLTAELLEIDSSISGVNFGQLLSNLKFLESIDAIDASNYPNLFRLVRIGAKVATIARGLTTTEQELKYLINDLPSTYLQMKNFPVKGDTDIIFGDLKVFLTFQNLNNKIFNGDISLISYLAEQTSENRLSLLAEATDWRESDIALLVGSNGFNIEATPSLFEEVQWIEDIAALMPLMQKAKIDAATLLDLELNNSDSDSAYAIRNLLSSGMSKKQWIEQATEMHDILREKQRDALVSFLIATTDENDDFNFKSKTDIYNYFLIDSQMSACQLTSRIKQAISAIQLFVQRMGLHLENGLYLNENKMDEWMWRKNYRVWEANRKVFLYPENYVLPEVRANQSKLYKDFEEALTQEEVNSDVAEKAFQHYLEQFKDIANLEVAQMVHDKEKDIMHVFATNQNDPVQLYHRSLKNRSVWSAWERVPVEVKGGILPLMHKGKLIVCWLDKREKKQEPKNIEFDSEPDNNNKYNALSSPPSNTEVRLAWTTKSEEGWEGKKITTDNIVLRKHLANSIVMIPMRNEFDELFISFEIEKYINGTEGNLILAWALKYKLSRFEKVDVSNNANGADSLFVKETKKLDNAYLIPPPNDESWFKSLERRKLNFSIMKESYGANNDLPGLTVFTGEFADDVVVITDIDSTGIIDTDVITAVLFSGRYNEQKLRIGNIISLRDPLSVNFETWANGKKFVRIDSTILLTQFNSNSANIIREIDFDFPFLSKNSILTNAENTNPYFIKIENRTYIIYPENKKDIYLNNEFSLDFGSVGSVVPTLEVATILSNISRKHYEITDKDTFYQSINGAVSISI